MYFCAHFPELPLSHPLTVSLGQTTPASKNTNNHDLEMGKINGCLKCLFIFFNIVFAIIGGLLIFGATQASTVSSQFSSVGTSETGWVWAFAIGVLGISCLGVYAGCTEKEFALRIFAGFMVAGMIIMLIVGMYVAVAKNKIRDAFPSATSDARETMQHEEFRTMLMSLQSTVECCGWSSAQDWGSEIPESCACEGSSEGDYALFAEGGCEAGPQGTTGPDHIYATPCGVRFFQLIDFALNISMGFLFGLAVTALLGLLVTLLMLHQVKRHDGGGASFPMKNY
uniref:Tetraspanin n=1 Tax=Neogobius melanostomus TaxID=47308 RepID=A0A8C6WQL6_9GOBI